MCGGRARCSTCRGRMAAGEEACPSAGADERGTLDRIGAPAGVRLARQFGPRGNVSILPPGPPGQPVFRATAPHRRGGGRRDVVVLFCDFPNRAELAGDHLPQDLLYVITLYVEALANAIRGAHGALSYVELDSICALFGLECDATQAAEQALQAAGAIESAIS